MERLALFGKGGGGKSTISTNLSYLYAARGLRVLHVGCDPKHDSTLRLLGERARINMVDIVAPQDPRQAVLRSPHGIDCVETGGPLPGVGCAGRGVILTMERFERLHLIRDDAYDVVIFDVLGDIVCGGFAAPLRHGFVQKLAIVVSDEPMSLFAANSIARMVCTYAKSGVSLAGLIGNCRLDVPGAAEVLRGFATRLGTTVLAHLKGDPLVRHAERVNQTVAQFAPDAPVTAALARLADTLRGLDAAALPLPTPIDDAVLDRFLHDTEAARDARPAPPMSHAGHRG
ncbi:MAG TPA: AAA family ATPase [Polyangia bacterium]|jgi:nitrogenase iron protein NifH